MDNSEMIIEPIKEHVSKNLTAWMKSSVNLDTLKKVSSRSGVGFGTVQRIKNGNGNPTINNLCDIAHSFGRRVEDLISNPENNNNAAQLYVAEPQQDYSPIVREIIDLIDAMDEHGKWILIGEARMLARLHRRKTS